MKSCFKWTSISMPYGVRDITNTIRLVLLRKGTQELLFLVRLSPLMLDLVWVLNIMMMKGGF